MITITATKLRNQLFECLNKVLDGETIIVRRNNSEVARLVPPYQQDWRKHMSIQPKVRVSPEELIKPLDNIWDDYT